MRKKPKMPRRVRTCPICGCLWADDSESFFTHLEDSEHDRGQLAYWLAKLFHERLNRNVREKGE